MTTEQMALPETPLVDDPGAAWWRRPRAALAGLLAVAVMLGVSEVLAGALPGGRSHVIAVGDQVIDAVPGWLERAVIERLGTSDKPFLIANILVVSGLLGAALGIVAARRFVLGALGVAVMASVGTAASLADPQAHDAAAVVVGVISAAAGIATLWLLLRAAGSSSVSAAVADASDEATPSSLPGTRTGDRRKFLLLAGGAVVVAGLGAFGGRMLSGSERINTIRRSISLPRPAKAAPPPPPGADLPIPRLSPLFTPNGRFYRIDTALVVPQVDPADWSLHVRGRVDRPFTLTYDELMAMPQIEADITLTCVSNRVGGHLISNARWQGVPLVDLLDRARARYDATQIVGRSVDGFTAGFPTVQALEQRQAMVAVAMNGEPLPTSHGFPARLVVPGLYGYVSATKWLSAIEFTRLEDFDGLLDPARLGQGRPDQDAVTHRCALHLVDPRRPPDDRRRGLGTDTWDRTRRGPDRRRPLAEGDARSRARRDHVAPVVPPLAGNAWEARHLGAGDGRARRDPDRRVEPTRPRRRHGPPHDRSQGHLRRSSRRCAPHKSLSATATA